MLNITNHPARGELTTDFILQGLVRPTLRAYEMHETYPQQKEFIQSKSSLISLRASKNSFYLFFHLFAEKN
jgi:hypothetical protein